MKPLFLLAFLREEMSVEDFLKPIKTELFEYIRTRRKLGASSHIVFEGELHPNDIDQNDLIYIMENYLKGNLGEWELEYLFIWVEMSEVFEDNVNIERILFDFSNPEINYPINKGNIKEALLFLKGEKAYLNCSGHYDINTYSSVIVDK